MSPIFNHHTLRGLSTATVNHLRRSSCNGSALPISRTANTRSFMRRWQISMRCCAAAQRRHDLHLPPCRHDGAIRDRIIDGASPTVAAAYEQRIEKLERRKLVLADQTANVAPPRTS